MDKLILQTVYVPVINGRAKFAVCEQNDKFFTFYIHVERQDNRIVLTPQELLALIDEFDDSKYMSATNFLKSKGIEI